MPTPPNTRTNTISMPIQVSSHGNPCYYYKWNYMFQQTFFPHFGMNLNPEKNHLASS
jgi:hypothetical protein